MAKAKGCWQYADPVNQGPEHGTAGGPAGRSCGGADSRRYPGWWRQEDMIDRGADGASATRRFGSAVMKRWLALDGPTAVLTTGYMGCGSGSGPDELALERGPRRLR